MKKAVVFCFAAGVLVLAGCAKQSQNENHNQNANKGTTQNQEREQEREGLIGSIKDAMGLGKKMRCTYTIKMGDQTETSVTYVEGKKYKSESQFGGQTQYSIFDGDIIYSWTKGEKEGTKMEMDCIKSLKKPESQPSEASETPQSVENPEDAFNNAVDTKCESVASIDFSIPTDITFKDQCQEMKQMMENLDKMKGQMPSGAGAGGAVPGANL